MKSLRLPPRICALLSAVFCLSLLAVGCFIYLVFLSLDMPIVNLEGDKLTPARVKAGERVTVYRSFRVLREQEFTVNRYMVKGDCKPNCELIDLSTSRLTLQEGDYIAVRRDHVIPERASPGLWTLQFTWYWRDRIGREHSLPLVPLGVVVE